MKAGSRHCGSGTVELERARQFLGQWILVFTIFGQVMGSSQSTVEETVDSLFFGESPPEVGVKVITEFAPLEAVFVAIPLDQVIGNLQKEAFFVGLVEIVAQYVPVVILINDNDHRAKLRIQELLSDQIEKWEGLKKNVEFFPSRFDTEWIRDYAPIFAMGQDGEMVILDNVYRDVRSESETRESAIVPLVREAGNAGGRTYLSDYGTYWRRKDDAAPLYFNQWLYKQHFSFARMIRTPIQLWGGDVAFDVHGRVFTSTETLILNGGDERAFRSWMERYHSVADVIYLRPLPNSIWHIDLYFRLGESDTVLLGKFDEECSYSSSYLRDLHSEATARLEWCQQVLKEKCPDLQVVHVPMPQLKFPGFVGDFESGFDNDASGENALPGEGTQFPVVYRSYTNSLLIRTDQEEVTAIVVPSYSGLEHLHGEVRSAYAKAFPKAKLHFLNCDGLAEEFGGVHCVTVGVPKVERQ